MDSTRNEWAEAQIVEIARRVLAEPNPGDARAAWAADILAQHAERRDDMGVLYVDPARETEAA